MRAFPKLTADSGRIVANRDIPSGELKLALFEVPEQLRRSDGPTLLLAGSTATSGWKRQYVELRHAGRTQMVPTPPHKSILGHASTQLDEREAGASVEIVLHDIDQWLTSCSDDDLQLGENLAVIGNEVVQFGDVTSLGAGRFRLGRLLRGRAGTDIANHSRSEPFALLQHGTLQPVSLLLWMLGSPVWAATADGSARCTLTPAREGLAPSGWMLSF